MVFKPISKQIPSNETPACMLFCMMAYDTGYVIIAYVQG